MEQGRTCCVRCRKVLHASAAMAEAAARDMERNPWFLRSVVFELRPYRCPVQDGWHIGNTIRSRPRVTQ
jgi:hypothetical protein